jgi:signal transduction histidine kinase
MQSVVQIQNNSKKNNSEVDLQNDLRTRIGIEIAELEERRFERIISNEINPIIESLENKINLCDSFFLQDINRSRMELTGLKNGLTTIKERFESCMFHVKHTNYNTSEEKQYLAESIENYIKFYKDVTISFTKIGEEDVNMIYSDIENSIKIIDELINNAINHGAATQIQIYLRVDLIDQDRKKIKLIVQDNGCGFEPESLNISDKYGLRLVQKRIALYNGEVYVESNEENGKSAVNIQWVY